MDERVRALNLQPFRITANLNSYTNILWCLGLQDRPWPERPIYATIRSMGRAGMERKTGVNAYIGEIQHLECTGKEWNA